MAWMVGTMLMVTARMMRWSSPIFWKMRKRRKARRMRICLIQAAPPEVRHRRATEESTTPESKSDQGSVHSRVSACSHRSVVQQCGQGAELLTHPRVRPWRAVCRI